MSQVLSELVRHLGRVAVRDGLAALADGELLRRFATDRDTAAFEALVWRHGGLVLGACTRVLGRGGDVEDAFQATFLALVRHARSVRAGGSLAGWLYRVARRVSTQARRERVRRTKRECLTARAEAVTSDAAEWADWRAMLDREVERLPRPYREAFVLCHLDGRAHEDAARELGCPLGTLHSRLARAKERLRARLGSVLVVAGVVVSERLVASTARAAEAQVGTAAVALSQGVWSHMALFKTKLVVVAVSAVVAVGSGGLLLGPPAATATQPPAAPAEPTTEELRRENERLRREVARLTKLLGGENRAAALRGDDDPPTDAQVLRAMTKEVADRRPVIDQVTIVKEKLIDRLDATRMFPLVGEARVRHRHWQCTVYFMESEERPEGRVLTPRVQVVYLDQNTLVRVAEIK